MQEDKFRRGETVLFEDKRYSVRGAMEDPRTGKQISVSIREKCLFGDSKLVKPSALVKVRP